MKFIKEFIKKPRNVYFSIILMLTLVTGLVSISFSYYIDESSTEGTLKFDVIDNRIQSPDLVDKNVSLAPHETKEIDVYVMSNNNFDTDFFLIYKTENDVKVYSDKEISKTITAKEVQNYHLIISNYSDVAASLELDLVSYNKGGMPESINDKVVEVLE